MTYQPDDLDRLLDEALASYALEEPRTGIEGRVLHHVRTAGRTSRFGWWRWAMAIPVAACLVMLAVQYRPHPRVDVTVPGPSPAWATAAGSPPAPDRSASAVRLTHRARRRRIPVAAASSDRDVFALPGPVSPEERALMTLATPLAPVKEIGVDVAPLDVAPIEIPKIEITPLTSGGER